MAQTLKVCLLHVVANFVLESDLQKRISIEQARQG